MFFYLLWKLLIFNYSCLSILQDEHLRCSLSPDSQIEDSGSEESTDDETVDIKDSGFHDAENDADQELDDSERILSGKLSETSACTAGDLYDYKVWCLQS